MKLSYYPLLKNIHHYDLYTFSWCMHCRFRPYATRAGRFFSRTGDGPSYLLVASLLALLDKQSGTSVFLLALLTFAIERPLYLVLKNCFKRNRPADAIQGFQSFVTPSDKFSFPSGHSSAAFAFATALYLFYPPLSLILYVWASLVALSRIFLGVHFPTDVLMGALMGTSTTLISFYLLYL